MVTYYIYEVPGHKNGATKDWKGRSKWNFNHYGVEPILIETIEGPDEPDMWKIVGDREWELADANGYNRGDHYLSIRQKASKHNFTFEARSKGGSISGRRNAETGRLSIAGKASAASPNSVTKQRVQCPYCDMVSNPGAIGYHKKSCKHKKRTAN